MSSEAIHIALPTPEGEHTKTLFYVTMPFDPKSGSGPISLNIVWAPGSERI